MALAPFVYWAQTTTDILLRVDLKDVERPQLLIEDEELEFSSIGLGAGGTRQAYKFHLEFYLPIDRDKSSYDVTDREVKIQLKKKEPDWWPRLLYQHEKLPWLKLDFDKFVQDSDESDDEKNAAFETGNLSSEDLLRSKYPEVYKSLQKEKLGYVSESKRKVYLSMYNLLMFCGFLYVFSIMAIRYTKDADEFVPKAFSTVGNTMKMLHLFMILEILHPLFGYTRGSVMEATLQVLGRNSVLFLLIDSEPRMQNKPVVFYLLTVYSSIELVRYPYYLLRLYDLEIGILTWLRYTVWLPLYPLGFICEGVIALRNIPYFEETGRFSIMLPNKWNLSFFFPNMLRVYLLFGFFPLMYTLMWHMYQLRCKKLGIRQHKSNRKNKED